MVESADDARAAVAALKAAPRASVDIEAGGAVFRSHSDTEVLLQLYADRGPAMVEELLRPGPATVVPVTHDGRTMATLLAREDGSVFAEVKIQDGNIVAIGGLMQMESSRKGSGLPGSSDSVFSAVLGNKANSGRKKELVVLIKPTIIRSAEDWEAQTRRTQTALDDMDAARARVIRLDGSVDK